MTRPAQSAGYGARVGVMVISLLALSGAALVVFYAPQAGSPESAFGDPPAERRVESQPRAMAAPPLPEREEASAPVAEMPTPEAEASPAPAQRIRPDPLARARQLASQRNWAAALEVYDRLIALSPSAPSLRIERARVLAWSGDPAAAATALREVANEHGLDTELRLELVRYLWWAGEPVAADSVLALVAGALPGDTAIDGLRNRIRAGAEPTAAIAEQWLRKHESPLEQLLLARAYAREGRPAAAAPYYRMALQSGAFPDSLALETASVAVAADSLALAADALAHFLRFHPDDHPIRLRRARVLSWAAAYEAARLEYEAVLAQAPDPQIRFELGRLLAWSGELGSAEDLLLEVVASEPDHPGALKLLGDLARWRGDWYAALAYYTRAAASDPEVEGLAEGVREAETLRLAATRRSPSRSRWSASVDGFGDSERFRWLSSQAVRSWGDARTSWRLTVLQDLWDGVAPPGVSSSGAGYGAEVQATTRVTRSWNVHAAAGARSLGGGFDLPTWSLGVSSAEDAATSLALSYFRQPALRRVATAAALEAETLSDLVQLTLSRAEGLWHLWSRVELERLGTSLGSSERATGVVALSRALGGGWSGFASYSALGANAPSPILPDWGPLYWSPASYHAQSIGLAYRSGAGEPWALGARLAPGYAWMREREAERRYAAERAPILGAALEAVHRRRDWQLEAAADWSGALERGYRAAALRLQVTYAPGER
jgi:tetratricopeptide (TPR) repeat protein